MEDHRILITGLGRSGTSWVMKCFDHHPRTLALHEPDLSMDPKFRRGIRTDGEIGSLIERLFSSRELRTVRKRPLLRKPYRSQGAHFARKGLIYGASAIDLVLRPLSMAPHWHIPDLARTDHVVPVAKVVTCHEILDRIASAFPELRVVFILRHPCGYAASMRRGMTSGKMSRHKLPNRALLERVHGIATTENVAPDRYDQIELLALRWSAVNSVIIEDCKRLPNIRFVRYEDLCRAPHEEFQALFDWAGLDYAASSRDFIDRSLEASVDGQEYHALVRNPEIAANKWRGELTSTEQASIRRIVASTEAAAFYADLRV